MEIGLATGGSEKGFIDEDSAERELESMYLIISFYLDIPSLVSFVCRNRLGCLGYKYVPSFIVERFITQSTNKLYFLPAIYFTVGGFVIFFFCEFFRVDQRRLTFERLDLLVSFCLPSKSEL